MHASGKLILRLCGGVCNKQRRRKVRVVVELDPGFCFMVNKPHECPDVPQLLKRFFLAPLMKTMMFPKSFSNCTTDSTTLNPSCERVGKLRST